MNGACQMEQFLGLARDNTHPFDPTIRLLVKWSLLEHVQPEKILYNTESWSQQLSCLYICFSLDRLLHWFLCVLPAIFISRVDVAYICFESKIILSTWCCSKSNRQWSLSYLPAWTWPIYYKCQCKVHVPSLPGAGFGSCSPFMQRTVICESAPK